MDKWLLQFDRKLARRPALLELPKGPRDQHMELAQVVMQNSLEGNAAVQEKEAKIEEDMEEDEREGEPEQTVKEKRWIPTLFGPYVPGLSERL